MDWTARSKLLDVPCIDFVSAVPQGLAMQQYDRGQPDEASLHPLSEN